MTIIDPRVDAYIAKSADFAQPILEHLRAVVHAACPEAQETIKWGFPHFMYKGMMCSMASFKSHCAFNFWKAGLLMAGDANREAMGQFGRLTSVADLPGNAEFEALIREAAALVDAGEGAIKRKAKPARPELEVPLELAEALAGDAAATATFDAFPPSCRRDYSEWIGEAKRPETKAKRVAEAIAMLREGKRRNWKYEA